MKKIKSLSVFFPAFNDSEILPTLILKAEKAAGQITDDFEIIVVNDGSKDDTKDVLKNLKKIYKSLRVITHKKNLGYGYALLSGFKSAKKEWVFYTDGDGQYDPGELVLLAGKITKNVDVVNGYKLNREDNFLRKIAGKIYNFSLKSIYNLPVLDVDCDFRLVKRSFLKKIRLTSASGAICLELVAKLKREGARFAEVGVNHYKRPFGKSQFFTFKNIIKTLNDNLKFFKEFYFNRKQR